MIINIAVALGYDWEGNHNNDLNIFMSDIGKMYSSAFTAENYTYFGACRTGAEYSGKIFAQEWVNMTRGTAIAAFQQTSYFDIYPDNRNLFQKIIGIKSAREKARAKYGFSAVGSLREPGLANTEGNKWIGFSPK